MRIALNGFGRLGRCIARVALQTEGVELVGINDVGSWEVLHYLFQRDSVHGALELESHLEGGVMVVGGREIALSQKESEPDFGEVDVVVEASGKFLTQALTAHHLKKGAQKVILSAPALDETPTFVLGVNHQDYAGEPILSNASCTTNAIAPLCKILDAHFGIESGLLTTIHSYTNDQKLLDHAHHSDKRRSRAAGINLIPTSTGSARALHRVLPELKGRLDGRSVRVPVADVSMVDLNLYLRDSVDLEGLRALLQDYALGEMRGILALDENFGVSSDFIGDPHSVILPQDLILLLGERHLKLMAWYDNEWGYANRIIEMARWICV